MKIVLVTSEVTYVPKNYLELFKVLLEKNSDDIFALVILQNLNLNLIKTAVGLSMIGAFNTGLSLIKNSLQQISDPRRTLFKKFGKLVKKGKTINSNELISWAKNNEVDLIINLRTRDIYKQEILDVAKLGCINIHHGLLPEYRGTMCDLHALYEGRPAGFSVHQMNKKIDDGKILKVIETSDGSAKNYMNFLERSSVIEGEELSKLIETIKELKRFPDGKSNIKTNNKHSRNPSKTKYN